ncbi:MAG TPA: PhoH family protein [Candidatus Coprenecus pullicola]|nr:PhoH family protein [Candidatus Coprenecus pullicola]
MTEKNERQETVIIDGIDSVDIYGVNNRLLDRLKNYFPNVRILARGSEIKLNGNPGEVGLLKERLETIMEAVSKGHTLSDSEMDRLLDYKSYPSEVQEQKSMKNDEAYNIVYGNEGRIVRAKTKNQRRLVDEYYKNDLIFALGPAGTGKTYTAIALAVRALKNKEVKKLILTRPAVEAGERLGFLPGDMKEKLDPYLQPLYDALHDMIHPRKLQILMEEGIIQIAPLAYMRGRTLDSAFVILDEAQNTSLGQLKMFLTRMGNNAKFIVTGDATQIDLPNKRDSGLMRGVELVKNIKGIAVINFGTEDMVRHPLVTSIIKAFDSAEEA